jgi:CBS domain-containing protein
MLIYLKKNVYVWSNKKLSLIRSFNNSSYCEFNLALFASVKTVMRSPAVTAKVSDSILLIAKKMIEKNVGAIIIINRDTIEGIITERDIVDKVVKTQKDPAKIFVKDVMSSPVKIVESESTVAEAFRIMRYDKIRRLAVTRKGKLIGIVTERRLLNWLYKTI